MPTWKAAALAKAAAFQGDGGKTGGLAGAPQLWQQAGLAGEVDPIPGGGCLEAGLGRRGPLVQMVLGEQQIQIGLLTALHRQAAHHVALGRELGHREAVDHDLHHRLLLGGEVGRIQLGQLHRGEQTIVEGDGHQTLLLPLHLGQQAGGAALEDALHAPLG